MVNTNGCMDNDPELFLIDFGYSSKYLNKDGKTHIAESEVLDEFAGNLTFASHHQMDFYKTGRRDDMISLFYLLVYMLNKNDLFVGKDPTDGLSNMQEVFHSIN